MNTQAGPTPLLISDDVANLLGIPLWQLTWWIYALRESRRYREFEVHRYNGSAPRAIAAPIKPIKELQQRLAGYLTAWYDAPAHVHGFVPTRSPQTNALHHRRKHWLLRVDLEDFFPTIHFGRVRGMFMAFPFEYPTDVATILAQLCCHRRVLPQGAPTSPIISNYICRRMDTHLAELARRERCSYTRYADDICLSTDRTTFPPHLAYLERGESRAGPALAEIVEANGFRIKQKKTKLTRATQRQRVTGLVVNKKVNVPRDYVRSVRNVLYIWRRYGMADAAASFDRAEPRLNWPPGKARPSFELVVRGRVQHVGATKGWDDPVYMRLAADLAELDPTFRVSPLPAMDSERVAVFTEGASDRLHLMAAARYFRARGDFTDLHLDFRGDAGQGGDRNLLTLGRSLARSGLAQTAICLFDRDDPETVRRAVGDDDWKNWGNGVCGAVIVAPPGRHGDERVCIEMLYSNDVLRLTNDEGRRLFLASEFDERTGYHHEGALTTTTPRSRSLIREEVYEFGTGKSVGLSKMDFAEAVYAQTAPYTNVDFEGFRGTFEVLRAAVSAAGE